MARKRDPLELNKREKDILKFIETELNENGYPPSVREIGKAVGLKSTATVHSYLGRLEDGGYISRKDKKGRTLQLIRGGKPYKPAQSEDKSVYSGKEMVEVPVVGRITAGAPILNVIRKNNLNNVLIVVTRYFGGILLGTGGLTRAYSNTALASIENGKIIEVENGLQVSLEIEYSENEKFKYYCEKNNIKIVETKYSENIIQKIELNEEEYNKLISKNMEINRQLPFKIKEIGILCRKFIEKVQ